MSIWLQGIIKGGTSVALWGEQRTASALSPVSCFLFSLGNGTFPFFETGLSA